MESDGVVTNLVGVAHARNMTRTLHGLEDVANGALPPLEDDGAEYDYTPEEIKQIKAMVAAGRAEIAADPSSFMTVEELLGAMRNAYQRLHDLEAEKKA